MIYLDNNSTTKPSLAALSGMRRALELCWGNPSNSHSFGEEALTEIQQATEHVARFIGGENHESIGFVSGGSEANRKVIKYLTHARKKVGFLETEHSSVLEAYWEFAPSNSVVLPVDAEGIIDLNELDLKLKNGEFQGVSIQWANSETGVIQPIELIQKLCAHHGVTLHVDSAQAIGKINLDPALVRAIDFLTFTAHKLHGPQGVGVIATGESQPRFEDIFPESHTRNTPGIIAFGDTIKERLQSQNDYPQTLATLRDNFENQLLELHPNLRIHGENGPRIPNTSNIQFDGVDGAALVAKLDQEGIMCSQVSACLTGRPEPSYVLTAMGVAEDDARSSVRFSFSILNTETEIESAAQIISDCYRHLHMKSSKLLS